MAAQFSEPEHFSPTARHAILWTREHLHADSLRMLKSLPILRIIDNRFLMVHAALHPTPNDTVRLHDQEQIGRSFAVLAAEYPATNLCFFGHTHRQAAYECLHGHTRRIDGPVIHLNENARYLVNPGSVGQPRGGHTKAAFLVFDAAHHTIQFCHVDYDHRACWRKAKRAGLLGNRNVMTRSAAWLWRRIKPDRTSLGHR